MMSDLGVDSGAETSSFQASHEDDHQDGLHRGVQDAPTFEPEVHALEAEPSDADSAYGASTKSSFLTSIASEVSRGTIENGRRYHSYGNAEYAFPNDDRERMS